LTKLRKAQWQAVFFGGTLRSLLLGRNFFPVAGKTRDIDIVVKGTGIEELRNQYLAYLYRETRFGGLKLQRSEWQFDLWPLDKTWALKHEGSVTADFDVLPSTTTFNLEAIGSRGMATTGKPRVVFSGANQFFYWHHRSSSSS